MGPPRWLVSMSKLLLALDMKKRSALLMSCNAWGDKCVEVESNFGFEIAGLMWRLFRYLGQFPRLLSNQSINQLLVTLWKRKIRNK